VEPPDFSGWLPIRVYSHNTTPTVDWCWFGDEPLTDPFFEQTVGARMRRPFCLLFRRQTSVEHLLELQQSRPGLSPGGFIFHVSRCGSTLLSQVLASSSRHRVLSEAPPIDEVLRVPANVTDAHRAEWLKGIIHSLGEPRGGAEKYFIKLDSWHLLHLSLIRHAFPDVPFVFLYRDPVEVMVSHQREPGRHMVPGMLRTDLLRIWETRSMDLLEYQARVLSEFYGALLHHCKSGQVRLVNYTELPEAAVAGIPEYFGVEWQGEEKQSARSLLQFHAKHPKFPFENDSLEKQQAATDRIRELADHWLRPIYQQLEQERLGAKR
jgi:gluconate kinase